MKSGFITNLFLSLVLSAVIVVIAHLAGEFAINPTTGPATKMTQTEKPVASPVNESPAPAASAKPATALVAPIESGPDLSQRLSVADAAKGKKLFRKCKSCHNAEKGAKNRVGPNLWNIIGRDKASIAEFNYSDPFATLKGNWTYKDLDVFLRNPRTFAIGTKMSIKGFKKPEERANLILFLRLQSDTPMPLP